MKANYDIIRDIREECCICYEDITDENKSLGCGHNNFHIICIDEWLKINPSCPSCRGTNIV